jgi:hypothetical protein
VDKEEEVGAKHRKSNHHAVAIWSVFLCLCAVVLAGALAASRLNRNHADDIAQALARERIVGPPTPGAAVVAAAAATGPAVGNPPPCSMVFETAQRGAQGCWEACCGTGLGSPSAGFGLACIGPESSFFLRLVLAQAPPVPLKAGAQLLPSALTWWVAACVLHYEHRPCETTDMPPVSAPCTGSMCSSGAW